MQRVSVASVLAGAAELGATVQVSGWVRTRRDSKAGVSFLTISDGSCFAAVQVVVPSELPNYQSDVSRLSTGCAVQALGTVVASAGKGQAIEILASDLTVLGWVEDPESYPLQPKRHSYEFLREVAHLRARTNTFGSVARLRHSVSLAVHEFFSGEGFTWVHTPIITASDCEGAGAMFRVSTLDLANVPRNPAGGVDFSQDFFAKEAFLTVSGQLELETYCLALSKVYTFGPTFRAENSNTSRHLAEFWMIEPEIAFANLADDADLAERFLKHVFRRVLEQRMDDMQFFAERVDPGCITRVQSFVESSFERMTYTEAIEQLTRAAKSTKFEFAVHWGMDLQAKHERYLTEKLLQKPVVVMNYPKDIKAFYMRLNDDERTVAAMDVLAPGIGEIIGGAQREERLDVFDRRLVECGMQPESYWWYRDLRRYGSVPHAGFGLGLERTLVYITGLGNVRDVIPFPRTPGNAEF